MGNNSSQAPANITHIRSQWRKGLREKPPSDKRNGVRMVLVSPAEKDDKHKRKAEKATHPKMKEVGTVDSPIDMSPKPKIIKGKGKLIVSSGNTSSENDSKFDKTQHSTVTHNEAVEAERSDRRSNTYTDRSMRTLHRETLPRRNLSRNGPWIDKEDENTDQKHDRRPEKNSYNPASDEYLHRNKYAAENTDKNKLRTLSSERNDLSNANLPFGNGVSRHPYFTNERYDQRKDRYQPQRYSDPDLLSGSYRYNTFRKYYNDDYYNHRNDRNEFRDPVIIPSRRDNINPLYTQKLPRSFRTWIPDRFTAMNILNQRLNRPIDPNRNLNF